jgi:hypothetical protein
MMHISRELIFFLLLWWKAAIIVEFLQLLF